MQVTFIPNPTTRNSARPRVSLEEIDRFLRLPPHTDNEANRIMRMRHVTHRIKAFMEHTNLENDENMLWGEPTPLLHHANRWVLACETVRYTIAHFEDDRQLWPRYHHYIREFMDTWDRIARAINHWHEMKNAQEIDPEAFGLVDEEIINPYKRLRRR